MQKARRHPTLARGAPTACKHMVSGTLSHRSSRVFSSFSRLTDSLSVVEEYFALEGGPPVFNPGFPSPSLLHGPRRTPTTGLSPSLARHSNASLVVRPVRFRSPLLTESLLLLLPVPTEMFHFSTFAPDAYAFSAGYPEGWVAPFGHPEIAAWLPAPSGFSQVPASFIASRHQDIHHVPLCWSCQPDAAIPRDSFGTTPMVSRSTHRHRAARLVAPRPIVLSHDRSPRSDSNAAAMQTFRHF